MIAANSLPTRTLSVDHKKCRMETCFNFDRCDQFKEIKAS